MGHDHAKPSDDAASWDAMYEEKPAIWSGTPNTQLVAEAAGIAPGIALDVGCGEGADAVWLAERGWTVDAVDISAVALERARAHAKALGAEIAFIQADLLVDPPSPSRYDLVSAQFFHVSNPPRDALLTSLGNAVTCGGRLLIVGHLFDYVGDGGDHAHMRDRMHTVDEMLELFPPPVWAVETAESRHRRGIHHGEMTDLVDSIVLLHRVKPS